jgi:hypothetical protein
MRFCPLLLWAKKQEIHDGNKGYPQQKLGKQVILGHVNLSGLFPADLNGNIALAPSIATAAVKATVGE